MTKEELDFIGSMNMCDEISNEAYEKIVCHVEETEISDDCVSRAEVLKGSVEVRRLDGVEVFSDQVVPIEYVKALPPVTPTHHKSATNGEEIIRAFPNLKYTIQNGRVVTTIGVASSFDLDWWKAPYKRGSENG